MPNKTLRGNVDILLAKKGAFANYLTPTVTELNDAAMVKNISCAVNDEFSINLTDPETSDAMSICDIATIESPTFANYEVQFDIFLDSAPAAVGVYNTARGLVKHAGAEYFAIVRIGATQGSAFASGQIISMFGVKTDNPVDILDPGSPMQMGARFKPTGQYLVEYAL